MTREEAIEILQGAIKKPNTKDGYLGQAIDMAIKALEQEPCEDIKAEIKQKREENRNGEYDKIFELCLLIIDKHTSGADMMESEEQA